MATVLVLEDDPRIRAALVRELRARDHTVAPFAEGLPALAAVTEEPVDVVVLDLGLPDIDGVEVVAGIRGWSSIPIIILTVRETEHDKVAALDAGADDYVTKPFGMAELLARLRAAIRRAHPSDEQPTVHTDDFAIDLAAKRVTTPGGEEIRLTPTEWGIVEALVRGDGRLVTQQQLLQTVWGPRYHQETNYLRVHMAHIRRKLEPEPSHPRYFHTEPGMGYRFTAQPADGNPPD